jgi:hypothetical protein
MQALSAYESNIEQAISHEDYDAARVLLDAYCQAVDLQFDQNGRPDAGLLTRVNSVLLRFHRLAACRRAHLAGELAGNLGHRPYRTSLSAPVRMWSIEG